MNMSRFHLSSFHLISFCRAHACALLALFGLLACSEGNSQNLDEDAVKTIDVQAFEKGLQNSPDAQLIDVRTPPEFAAGHVPAATMVDVKARDFEARISAFDKNRPTYVYCRSGKRSARAVAIMAELGFTELYNLDGGMLAWTKAEKPVETPEK